MGRVPGRRRERGKGERKRLFLLLSRMVIKGRVIRYWMRESALLLYKLQRAISVIDCGEK